MKDPVSPEKIEHPPQLATQRAPADPDLSNIIEQWATLPPAIRAGIVAMVNAAKSQP